MSNNEMPQLASDGLCENEGCSIRGTNQCPIYRMVYEITTPQINNVINLPNNRGENAGFQVSEGRMKSIQDDDVIHLAEEKTWKEILEILKLEDAAKKGSSGYQMIK